jgi:hypothetical protein
VEIFKLLTVIVIFDTGEWTLMSTMFIFKMFDIGISSICSKPVLAAREIDRGVTMHHIVHN